MQVNKLSRRALDAYTARWSRNGLGLLSSFDGWGRTANPLREGTRHQEYERDRMARVLGVRDELRSAARRIREAS